MHQLAISASFLGFFLPHMAPCEARTPGALHGDARPQVSPWHPWVTGTSEALSVYQLGKQRPAREFHGENVTRGSGYRDAGRAEKPNPDSSHSWTSPHAQVWKENIVSTQTLGSLEEPRPGRGPSHRRTAVRAPTGSEPGGGDTWLFPPSSPLISRWLLLAEPRWTPGSGKGAWEMWFAGDGTQLPRARQRHRANGW